MFSWFGFVNCFDHLMLAVRCIALWTRYIHKIHGSIVTYESRIQTDFYIWQTLYHIVLWRNIVPGNSLQWRYNGRDSVSNHQPHDCLLNRLFRRRSKKTSKLRVTGLCVGNSPVTGEFPAQMASNAEMFSFDDVIVNTRDQIEFIIKFSSVVPFINIF